jgi:hypothetical protein
MDNYTLLSIMEMLDVRIQKLTEKYEAKGITLEMPIITELCNIKRELQNLYYNDQLTDDDYYEKGHCPNCGGLIDLHGPKCAGE